MRQFALASLLIGYTRKLSEICSISLSRMKLESEMIYIPYSKFCEYRGPTTKKHTTFSNYGRNIHKSVKRGYNFKLFVFRNNEIYQFVE